MLFGHSSHHITDKPCMLQSVEQKMLEIYVNDLPVLVLMK
jgi:hypothetical protein